MYQFVLPAAVCAGLYFAYTYSEDSKLKAAMLASERGDYAAAIEVFRSIHDADPEDFAARFNLAETYMRSGLLREQLSAKALFAGLLDENEDHIPSLLCLGLIKLRENPNLDKASLFPSDKLYIFQMNQPWDCFYSASFQAQTQPEKAIDVFKDLLPIIDQKLKNCTNSDMVEKTALQILIPHVKFAIAQCKYDLGHKEEAIRDFKELDRSHPYHRNFFSGRATYTHIAGLELKEIKANANANVI